jgi:hypothetical protein
MSDCILLTVEEFKHLKKYKWCKGCKQDSKEIVTINVIFMDPLYKIRKTVGLNGNNLRF